MTTATSTVYTVPTISQYTNLGALPTPTSLPPACLTQNVDFQMTGIGVTGFTYYTIGCAVSTCCPSHNYYSSAYQWYSQYYSPAVCPSGYEPVSADPIISTAPGETVRFCCPSSMASGAPSFTSAQAPSLTAPYDNWACQAINPNVVTSTVVVYDDLIDQKVVSTRSTTLPYYYQIAYPIQIRWRADQLIDGTISTTSSTIAGSATENSASASTSTSSASPINPPHHAKGVSKGAIIGMSVGIPLAAVSVLATAVFVWWRRRKVSRRVVPLVAQQYSDTSSPVRKPDMETSPGRAREPIGVPELQSATRYELDAVARPSELPGSRK